MKRTLITMATVAAISAPAIASADMTVYGRAHLSVDMLDNGADSALNVSSNSSRLGFKGSHDLTDDLHAIFQIEQTINFDVRGGEFATRNSFGGVKGGFGTLRLGYFDTPYKIVRGRVDPFGDRIGDARNITGLNAVGENRFRNGVHYQTPDLGGLFVDIHYSTNNENQRGTTDNDNDALSVALTYSTGSLYAAIAHETLNDAEDDSVSALRAAVYYDLGPLRIGGLFQQADVTADDSSTVLGVGGRYTVGNTALKAQYYTLDSDLDEADASLLAIGVDQKLASNFTVYAAYAMTDNDSNQSAVAYGGGHGANPGIAAPGESTSGLSLGMIYNF